MSLLLYFLISVVPMAAIGFFVFQKFKFDGFKGISCNKLFWLVLMVFVVLYVISVVIEWGVVFALLIVPLILLNTTLCIGYFISAVFRKRYSASKAFLFAGIHVLVSLFFAFVFLFLSIIRAGPV